MDGRTHGIPGADMAEQCFSENLENFINDTEKNNLYNGLRHLAKAVNEMQRRLRKIEQDISDIEDAVRRRR